MLVRAHGGPSPWYPWDIAGSARGAVAQGVYVFVVNIQFLSEQGVERARLHSLLSVHTRPFELQDAIQGRIGRALVLGRLLRINTHQLERG